MTSERAKRVLVIGGGASGMIAAAHAAYMGASVLLCEQNRRLGVKVRITGKGRCNVTNDCDRETFLRNVPRNPRFLYAALSRFSTEDVKNFFEMLGVSLKVERGNRVFPVSDRAHEIADALAGHLKDLGVEIKTAKITRIETAALPEDPEKKRVTAVHTSAGERLVCDAVILASGGASYPRTGSDGSGYRIAKALGHTVTPLSPSLVPLVTAGSFHRELQGLSLRNVTLRVYAPGKEKPIFEDFGEMLFTHFGISGPLVLSASAHLDGALLSKGGTYRAEIDLKPALEQETLDLRIASDFQKYQNRDLINALSDLLPQKLIAPVISHAALDPRKKVNEVTREERRRLLSVLKAYPITVRAFRPIDEAIITRGGIETKEVEPGTMMSKRIQELYFAGEILDVDAYTGGFNLQIAWSTGVLAGEAAGTPLAE